MKQVIIQGGKGARVDQVDRGVLIGYGETEWMRRARKQQEPLERIQRTNGVLYLVLASAIAVTSVIWFQDLNPGALLFSFAWGGLGAFHLVAFHYLSKRNRDSIVVPGLYENGIEHPTHLFIPYSEISKIEFKTKNNVSPKKRGNIRIRSKFAKKPGSFTDGWIVPAEFLGTDGLETLIEAVDGKLVDEGPPKLVTYIGKGGVVEQEIVPEIEDA